GDVTLYVNMDENSEFFATRQIILDAVTNKLRWLVQQHQVDDVIVAGHSLGSVVAHNAINRLILEAYRDGQPASVKPNEVAKVRVLVRFGSPIDKVDYFFRIHVAPDEFVRSQVLAARYPFARRLSSKTHTSWERDYADLQFDERRRFPRFPDAPLGKQGA